MNSHCLSKNISVFGFVVSYIRGLTVCMVHCNNVSHWLAAYLDWSLHVTMRPECRMRHKDSKGTLSSDAGRKYASVNWVIIGSGNGLAQNSVPSLYLNQWWIIVNWMLSNKFQLNSNWNASSLVEENVFENVVCNMVAILFMPHMSPWCPNTQWSCSGLHADQISTYSVPCHVNIFFTLLPHNSNQGSDLI